MRFLPALALVLVTFSAIPRPTGGVDAPQPRLLVERAIAAAGGWEKLGNPAAISWKERSKSHEAGEPGEFTDEWTYQFPGRARFAMIELSGFKRTIVSVLNGEKAWVSVNGRVDDMEPRWIREYQERTHAAWVATLTPLSDKAFSLDLLGEKRVDSRTVVGVRVSYKGRRDVGLYFDKQTGLLQLVETSDKNPDAGTEHVVEMIYSEYKDVGGVKRPSRFMSKRDGKVTVEGEMFDYKEVKQVDDDLFVKPK